MSENVTEKIDADRFARQLAAIGQEHLLSSQDDFEAMLPSLKAIDSFYQEIGGIVGYQEKVLSLLHPKAAGPEKIQYHSPPFIDISQETSEVKEAIQWGIDAMPNMAEIYPLGGAADRLHLVDEKTGLELPAAKLPFMRKNLLALLIEDLQAREELYFQKWKRKTLTPIAMMTSEEKDNHSHVVQICEENGYFGRPKESIRFFTQPLVPAFDEKGKWRLMAPGKLLLKPGGHGAIWKLARDRGIFDWFRNQNRNWALVRQINNPLAGLDYGLLVLQGIGSKKKMHFGFASCPRLLKSAEGVNVLIEKEGKMVISNIEYCDFAKAKIEDAPLKEGDLYSRFSSNTNILFVDLEAIDQAVQASPFPGLLINLKEHQGLGKVGRLESTMQNIADVFVEPKNGDLTPKRTFITYNLRHKTISCAKKAWRPGGATQETAENCFYDWLKANHLLLKECGVHLPLERSIEQYLEKGPEVLFLYHPALGPLYSAIRQKIQGGKIALGSELNIGMGQLEMRNLQLAGSLQIIAHKPFQAKCILDGVRIDNQGVDWEKSRPFWKMNLVRKESVQIIFKGGGTFLARNRSWKGSRTFVIEEGEVVEG